MVCMKGGSVKGAEGVMHEGKGECEGSGRCYA